MARHGKAAREAFEQARSGRLSSFFASRELCTQFVMSAFFGVPVGVPAHAAEPPDYHDEVGDMPLDPDEPNHPRVPATNFRLPEPDGDLECGAPDGYDADGD